MFGFKTFPSQCYGVADFISYFTGEKVKPQSG